MPVFFVSPDSITHQTISVTGDLLVHLRDSLRVKVGALVLFGDGSTQRYQTEITAITNQALIGRIIDIIAEPATQVPTLILGQTLLKGEKMDWVIQKATELGVSEIVPIESRHSVVQLKTDRVDHQLARWRRIALEAAQQSEQWRVPTIAVPQSLASLLTGCGNGTMTCMLTERQNGINLQVVDLPKDHTRSVLVLIGPEGGWSQEEMEATNQPGIVSITLGQHILRAETAAIAAISILQSRLGQLG